MLHRLPRSTARASLLVIGLLAATGFLGNAEVGAASWSSNITSFEYDFSEDPSGLTGTLDLILGGEYNCSFADRDSLELYWAVDVYVPDRTQWLRFVTTWSLRAPDELSSPYLFRVSDRFPYDCDGLIAVAEPLRQDWVFACYEIANIGEIPFSGEFVGNFSASKIRVHLTSAFYDWDTLSTSYLHDELEKPLNLPPPSFPTPTPTPTPAGTPTPTPTRTPGPTATPTPTPTPTRTPTPYLPWKVGNCQGGPGANPNTMYDDFRECAPCQAMRGAGAPIIRVNTTTGNLIVEDTDFTYGSVGPAATVRRTYNLQGADRVGLFGRGWSSNLEMKIAEKDAGQSAEITGGSGGTLIYSSNGDGSYSPPGGIRDLLIKNGDASWDLTLKPSRAVYHFDSAGRLFSLTDRNGNKLTYLYESNRPTQIVDSAGRTFQLIYDAEGLVSELADPLGRTAQFVYGAVGNLLHYTDMAGQVFEYEYDAEKLITALHSPNGDWDIETQPSYDGKPIVASVENDLGEVRQYTPSPSGNGVTVQNSAGEASGFLGVGGLGTLAYTDPTGASFGFQYDGSGRVTRFADPMGRVALIEYDSKSNPTRVTDSADNRTNFQYDAADNLISVVDPCGRQTRMAYGARGNLLSVTNALGGQTLFTCDARGLLQFVTTPNGGRTAFAHDSKGNTNSATDPIGKKTSYVYDAVGRPVRRTDPNGVAVDVSYDGIDRVTRLQYPDGDIAVEYGCCGVTAMTGKDSRLLSLEYDGANRVEEFFDANGFQVYYIYDAAGRLANITWYPGGFWANYEYDGAGRLLRVEDSCGHFAAYEYDQSGALVATLYSNGAGASAEYDNLGHLASLRHSGPAEALPEFFYTRDPRGNILSTASRNYPIAPPAIANGTGAYDASDRLLSLGAKTYLHDNNGNLIRETAPGRVTNYVYDNTNRLIRVDAPEGSTFYEYDAQGRRISKQAGSEKTLFLVDINTNSTLFNTVLLRADASGNPIDYFVYGTGLAWRVDAANGEAFYYHFDRCGSTVAITDSYGNRVARYAYGPFGEVVLQEGAAWNPFLFVGRYGVQYEGNGLYYMNRRYYNAETGRFLAKDPLGMAGGLNSYAYVRNNPINAIDPLGLDDYDPTKDYCGSKGTEWVPDRIALGLGVTTVDMNHACYNHDNCYNAQKGKMRCEVEFYKDIVRDNMGPFAVVVGALYAGATTMFGSEAYYGKSPYVPIGSYQDPPAY